MRNVIACAAMVIGALATGVGCGSSTNAIGSGDGGGGGLAGNGGGGTIASCTISQTISGSGTIMLCEEVSGSSQQIEAVRQSCTAQSTADAGLQANVSFQYAGCSHANALGGCRISQGGVTATEWYYQDPSGLGTSDDIRMLCDQIAGTFIAP